MHEMQTMIVFISKLIPMDMTWLQLIIKEKW